MNKRVKIVATLGPAVEIRGGKKIYVCHRYRLHVLLNTWYSSNYFESKQG